MAENNNFFNLLKEAIRNDRAVDRTGMNNDVDVLIEMFPNLHIVEAKRFLSLANGDCEEAVERILQQQDMDQEFARYSKNYDARRDHKPLIPKTHGSYPPPRPACPGPCSSSVTDDDELWRQRRKQHNEEMAMTVERACQRRAEEEKHYEQSKQCAQEKAKSFEKSDKTESGWRYYSQYYGIKFPEEIKNLSKTNRQENNKCFKSKIQEFAQNIMSDVVCSGGNDNSSDISKLNYFNLSKWNGDKQKNIVHQKNHYNIMCSEVSSEKRVQFNLQSEVLLQKEKAATNSNNCMNTSEIVSSDMEEAYWDDAASTVDEEVYWDDAPSTGEELYWDDAPSTGEELYWDDAPSTGEELYWDDAPSTGEELYWDDVDD